MNDNLFDVLKNIEQDKGEFINRLINNKIISVEALKIALS